jgi:hypothetical protein
MLRKSHSSLNLIRRILLNQLHNLSHHLLLVLLRILEIRSLIRKLTASRVALRQVRVQPHLHPSITVNTHQILRHPEVPHEVK